jgi:hypothetical protein
MVAVFIQKFGSGFTPNVLLTALRSGRTTLDIMSSGYDIASGWGILDALLLDRELSRVFNRCAPTVTVTASGRLNGTRVHLNPRRQGSFLNVGLTVTATDSCGGNPITTVTVWSNQAQPEPVGARPQGQVGPPAP